MPERRTKQVTANIERTLQEKVWKVLSLEDVSGSVYLRALIIKDLLHRGELGPEQAETML